MELMLNFYVYALFFASIIVMSRIKKNAKMSRYYKREPKRSTSSYR
jgi:hypothetical protein